MLEFANFYIDLKMLAFKKFLLANKPQFYTRLIQTQGERDNDQKLNALIQKIEGKFRMHRLFMSMAEFDLLEQSSHR